MKKRVLTLAVIGLMAISCFGCTKKKHGTDYTEPFESQNLSGGMVTYLGDYKITLKTDEETLFTDAQGNDYKYMEQVIGFSSKKEEGDENVDYYFFLTNEENQYRFEEVDNLFLGKDNSPKIYIVEKGYIEVVTGDESSVPVSPAAE